jgi:alkylation response protein AidB-like acyl-CoA dehydrogenase
MPYLILPSFTVGCKTEDGFTVILVERGEGVETKPIKTSYSSAAGTAYITVRVSRKCCGGESTKSYSQFENVKVPVENTLGPEGGGLFVILSNFNHERWVMCCGSARSQRMVIEECLKYVGPVVLEYLFV